MELNEKHHLRFSKCSFAFKLSEAQAQEKHVKYLFRFSENFSHYLFLIYIMQKASCCVKGWKVLILGNQIQ